jgi:Ras-related protein Rab-18
MVVANKTDLTVQRQVSTEEGHEFAKQHGCLFVETSAKNNVAVGQAFEELLMKVRRASQLRGRQPHHADLRVH